MTARHNMANPYPKQRGATLIELIITIVIISISLAGILSVVNLTTRHSADPVVQHQAIAIAESYLEEISLLPVTVTATPDTSVAGDRSTFDNITDYNGLNDTGAIDQNGDAIIGLENYTIVVSITDETVSGITMKKITVTVSRPSTQDIVLSGYRADY